MRLTSFAFNDNDELPPRYKGNVNPPLTIDGVPEAAKSLALIMHDPDGVSGDYIHWMVWDIDPTTAEILEDGAPSGSTEGVTSAGTTGYSGPKPPAGSGPGYPNRSCPCLRRHKKHRTQKPAASLLRVLLLPQ